MHVASFVQVEKHALDNLTTLIIFTSHRHFHNGPWRLRDLPTAISSCILTPIANKHVVGERNLLKRKLDLVGLSILAVSSILHQLLPAAPRRNVVRGASNVLGIALDVGIRHLLHRDDLVAGQFLGCVGATLLLRSALVGVEHESFTDVLLGCLLASRVRAVAAAQIHGEGRAPVVLARFEVRDNTLLDRGQRTGRFAFLFERIPLRGGHLGRGSVGVESGVEPRSEIAIRRQLARIPEENQREKCNNQSRKTLYLHYFTTFSHVSILL